jgi:hypothetical protein
MRRTASASTPRAALSLPGAELVPQATALAVGSPSPTAGRNKGGGRSHGGRVLPDCASLRLPRGLPPPPLSPPRKGEGTRLQLACSSHTRATSAAAFRTEPRGHGRSALSQVSLPHRGEGTRVGGAGPRWRVLPRRCGTTAPARAATPSLGEGEPDCTSRRRHPPQRRPHAARQQAQGRRIDDVLAVVLPGQARQQVP